MSLGSGSLEQELKMNRYEDSALTRLSVPLSVVSPVTSQTEDEGGHTGSQHLISNPACGLLRPPVSLECGLRLTELATSPPAHPSEGPREETQRREAVSCQKVEEPGLEATFEGGMPPSHGEYVFYFFVW